MKTGATIRLRDGRRLGYAEFGDPAGAPIFYFSGGNGSRLQARPEPGVTTDSESELKGIRLIGTDRPGLGLSDFKPGRTLLDWPDNVIELADALGIDRFAVMGISAGGPYALACATKIPQRLTACGIAASAAHPSLTDEGRAGGMKVMLFMYRRLPWLTRAMMWWMTGRYASHGAAGVEKLLSKRIIPVKGACESDRRLWESPAFRRLGTIDRLEGFRQGTRGLAYEVMLWTAPWGFELEDITCSTIFLWHGEKDVLAPISSARLMAQKIPGCTATFYSEEGHSVGHVHFKEILETLAR